MDQAIQKAVREAVKTDFDHTSDYYFLIFNHLTKSFDTSSSSNTAQQQQQQTSSQSQLESLSSTSSSCDEKNDSSTSSDKEYLDYLLFDSGDGVIVRIERRSPSPSTLKIKNCDQINDQTNKIFNYDLNLKISSTSATSNWIEDGLINDFIDETKSLITSQTSTSIIENNMPLLNSNSSTLITEGGGGMTSNTACIQSPPIKKFKKLSSHLINTSDNHHNEPMKQLQNNNILCNPPSTTVPLPLDSSSSPPWTTMTATTSMMIEDNTKGIIQQNRNNHHEFRQDNNSKVQQNNGGISGNHRSKISNSKNISSSKNDKINNNSNSSNHNTNMNGHHGGTDSDDDNIIFDSNLEKPWICKDCNRGYKWRNSLTCHQKNECGKPPKYYCTKLCGYRTNIRSNLRRHLNTKCSSKDKLVTVPGVASLSSSQSHLSTSLTLNNRYNNYVQQRHHSKPTTKKFNHGNGNRMNSRLNNKALS